MKPATMLQELIRHMRFEPSKFSFQDGFVLDELRRQRKYGVDMTGPQQDKVQQLYQQYLGKNAS